MSSHTMHPELTIPAKMTDDHYALLQRFWQNTDYLQARQLARITKRVDVVKALQEKVEVTA